LTFFTAYFMFMLLMNAMYTSVGETVSDLSIRKFKLIKKTSFVTRYINVRKVCFGNYIPA